MPAHISIYSVQELCARLRNARETKRLTQREVASQAGLPQGHISRIENSQVDAKLSTVIELARLLDLELVLIPRPLIPAVAMLTARPARGSTSTAASAAIPPAYGPEDGDD